MADSLEHSSLYWLSWRHGVLPTNQPEPSVIATSGTTEAQAMKPSPRSAQLPGTMQRE
jgi:hypothetical protein